MTAANQNHFEQRPKGRRSAFIWGVVATLITLIALGAFFGTRDADPRHDHIALYELSGIIYDDTERDMVLERIQQNDAAKALILQINSPGGTTAGSEALFDRLRKIAEHKPVIATISEIAASGGYIAAIGTDRIFARETSLTGSIGVIMEYPDVTNLMEKIGVEMRTTRSSELKAAPSPFRAISPEAQRLEQELINDSYQWFQGLVSDRRALKGQQLQSVTQGQVFTGRMAIQNGLIDEIGGLDEAISYLESEETLTVGLALEDYTITYSPDIFSLLNGKFSSNLGKIDLFAKTKGPILYSIMQ